MAKIHMKLLDIPDIGESDWRDFINIRNDMNRETNPDIPVASFENQKIEYSSLREWETLVEVWLVYDEEDNCVAFFDTMHPKPIHPNYETNKVNLWFGLYVREAYRRQGIGSQILQTIVERARFFEVDTLYTRTAVESGHQFAESLNAQTATIERVSRLLMADLDWDMLQNWVDAGKSRNPDIEIIRIDGLPSEEDIEAYCQLMTDLMRIAPREDVEDDVYTLTVEELHNNHQRNLERGHQMIVLCAKDKDSALIGLATMFYEAEVEKNAFVGLTGVLPNYQGRGLGKYLKALMTYDVRDNYPKVQSCYTSNAEVNAPMLSINVRMGFKPHKQISTYKISVEELEDKL